MEASEAGSTAGVVKIRLEHLEFGYPGGPPGSVSIIDNLSLDVRDHEFLAIVGASGCGKTTLLNIIAGLLPPTGGAAFIDGRKITGPGPARTVVFQDDAVFPWFTVLRNVEYGLRIAGMNREERAKRASQSLALVGLTGSETLYPRQLSGGMRKQVDVARAIATRPEVLMMDEPFAALDVMTKANLQEQFLEIWNQTRMTVVFVTHDLEEALFWPTGSLSWRATRAGSPGWSMCRSVGHAGGPQDRPRVPGDAARTRSCDRRQ